MKKMTVENISTKGYWLQRKWNIRPFKSRSMCH
jgi:hypothetical protein